MMPAVHDISELFELVCQGRILPVIAMKKLASVVNDDTVDLEDRKKIWKIVAAHINHDQEIPHELLKSVSTILNNQSCDEGLRKLAAYVCMLYLSNEKNRVDTQALQTSLSPAMNDHNLTIRAYAACALSYIDTSSPDLLVYYLEDAVKISSSKKYAIQALHHMFSGSSRYSLAGDIVTLLASTLTDSRTTTPSQIQIIELLTYAINHQSETFAPCVLDALEHIFNEKERGLTNAYLNALLVHLKHLREFKSLPPMMLKQVRRALNRPDTSPTALAILNVVLAHGHEKEKIQVKKILDALEQGEPVIDVPESTDETEPLEDGASVISSPDETERRPLANGFPLPNGRGSDFSCDVPDEKTLGQLLAEFSTLNQQERAVSTAFNTFSLQQQIEAVHAASQRDSVLLPSDDAPPSSQAACDEGTSQPAVKKPINTWDQQDCARWAERVKSQSAHSRDPAFMAEMIAVVSRGNELTTTHQPRTTQLLALLSLLNTKDKGRLAQIATGEGKSTIVAMLAAIKVLQGEKVDVVTSSPILAQRDAEARRSFFELFNISVADNGSPEPDLPKSSCYEADIVYGDAGHFQWDLLSTEYLLENIRVNRPYSTVIVDEVDSMLIDEGAKNALIGGRKPAMDHLVLLLSLAWTLLTSMNTPEHFHQKKNGRLYFQYDELSEVVEVTNRSECLTTVLHTYLTGLINDKDEQGNPSPILIPAHLKPFALSQAKLWAESAVMACLQLEENRDYVMSPDDEGQLKISPVDYQNTGITLVKSAWNNGLQQFLQLKHGLKVTSETITTCYISNMGYFQRYGNQIYGLTGTLGGKDSQDLLQHIYPVDLVFIPTYKTKRLIEIPPMLSDTAEDWMNAILKSVQTVVDEKRAILVICESISKAKELEEALKRTQIKTNRIIPYTRSDHQEQLAVLDEVQSGDVIIATALAGRGTDIQTSAEVEQHGGLHVCLTYLPNQRGRDQAIGRTARQGHQGSAQLIINKIDAESPLKQRYLMLGNADTIENLMLWRDSAEQDRLEDIKTNDIEKIRMQDELFARFCRLHNALRKEDHAHERLAEIEEQWGFWLKTLDNTINEARGFDREDVFAEFERFEQQARADFTTHHMRNPSHWVKQGNRCQLDEEEGRQQAIAAYTKATQLDPTFAVQAFYNRAEVTIRDQSPHYKERAIRDLREAKVLIQDKLLPQLEITRSIDGLAYEGNDQHQSARSQQIKHKIDLLHEELQHIDAAIDGIGNIPGDVRISQINRIGGSFTDNQNRGNEIQELRDMGLQHLFETEEVPEEDDDDDFFGMICVAVLGVVEIAVGACLMMSGHFYLAGALISEGIGDVFCAVRSAMTGHFSWDEYKTNKLISLGITALTWGYLKVKAVTMKSLARTAASETTVKTLAPEAAKFQVTTTVVHSGIGQVTLTREAAKLQFQQQFTKTLFHSGIQQVTNIGLDALGRHVVAQYKGDIEQSVRDELFEAFNEPGFRAMIDKLMNIDAYYQNDTFTQQLKQLAAHIIYPKQNKIAGITSAIINGTLANQHAGVSALLRLKTIADASFQLSNLCEQFCQEFKARVGFMDHKLSATATSHIDLTQDRTVQRNALYEALVHIVAHRTNTRLHTDIFRPAADTVMDKHVNAFSERISQSVNKAKRTTRDFVREVQQQKQSNAFLRDAHIPQSVKPILDRSVTPQTPQAPHSNSVLALRSPAETEMMKAIERTVAKHHQERAISQRINQTALSANERTLIPLHLNPWENEPYDIKRWNDQLLEYSKTAKPTSLDRVVEYVAAPSKGVVKGVVNVSTLLSDAFVSPIEKGLKPLSTFIVDTGILLSDIAVLTAFGGSPNAHALSIAENVERAEEMQKYMPKFYRNAKTRMETRTLDVLLGSAIYCKHASGPEIVETAFQIGTEFAAKRALARSAIGVTVDVAKVAKFINWTALRKGTTSIHVHYAEKKIHIQITESTQSKTMPSKTSVVAKRADDIVVRQPSFVEMGLVHRFGQQGLLVNTHSHPSGPRKPAILAITAQKEIVPGTGLEKHSLDNRTVREWYLQQLSDIPRKIDSTASQRQQSLQAIRLRNEIKIQARALMKDQEAARNLPPPISLNELYEKAIERNVLGQFWKFLYEGTQKSNKAVNQSLAMSSSKVEGSRPKPNINEAPNLPSPLPRYTPKPFLASVVYRLNPKDISKLDHSAQPKLAKPGKEHSIASHKRITDVVNDSSNHTDLPTRPMVRGWERIVTVSKSFLERMANIVIQPSKSIDHSRQTFRNLDDALRLLLPNIEDRSKLLFRGESTESKKFAPFIPDTYALNELPSFPCRLTRIARDYSHYLPVQRLSIADIQHLEFKSGIEILNFIITPKGEVIYARSIDGHNHDRLGNGERISGGGEIHFSKKDSGAIQMDYFNNCTGAYMRNVSPEKLMHLPDFLTFMLEREGFDGKLGPACKGKFKFFVPEAVMPMTPAKEEYMAWETKQRAAHPYTPSNRQWTDETWLASTERQMAIAEGVIPLKTEAEVSRELADILKHYQDNKTDALRNAANLFALQPRRFSTAAVNDLAHKACYEKQWEFFIHLYCTERLSINHVAMAIVKASQDQRWYVVTLLLENHATDLSTEILRNLYNAAEKNQQLHIARFILDEMTPTHASRTSSTERKTAFPSFPPASNGKLFYRGEPTGRHTPVERFENGISPHGNNTDLTAHVSGESVYGETRNSAYVTVYSTKNTDEYYLLSLKEIKEITVPLPSQPINFNSSDSLVEIVKKMDRYFDDIIRDFPEATKELLREMYYQNKNIDISKKLLLRNASGYAEIFLIPLMIRIDSRLAQSPIYLRLVKIHELLHVGQAHSWILKFGYFHFSRAFAIFAKFTEQSVVIAEKILIDALRYGAFEFPHYSDLDWVTQIFARDTVITYLQRKDLSFHQCLQLQHRGNYDNLTMADHDSFLGHPLVAQFLADPLFTFSEVPGLDDRLEHISLIRSLESEKKQYNLNCVIPISKKIMSESNEDSHQSLALLSTPGNSIFSRRHLTIEEIAHRLDMRHRDNPVLPGLEFRFDDAPVVSKQSVGASRVWTLADFREQFHLPQTGPMRFETKMDSNNNPIIEKDEHGWLIDLYGNRWKFSPGNPLGKSYIHGHWDVLLSAYTIEKLKEYNRSVERHNKENPHDQKRLFVIRENRFGIGFYVNVVAETETNLTLFSGPGFPHH